MHFQFYSPCFILMEERTNIFHHPSNSLILRWSKIRHFELLWRRYEGYSSVRTQRTHQELKHRPATWAYQFCRAQPVIVPTDRRCTLVELVVVHAIQLAVIQEKKQLEMVPSSGTNKSCWSQPVVSCMRGRLSLVKPAVFNAIQHSHWVEEQELEYLPAATSNQFSRSQPVVWAMCRRGSPIKLAIGNTIQCPFKIKKHKLEDMPSSSAHKSRCIHPVLSSIGTGSFRRRPFVEPVVVNTI